MEGALTRDQMDKVGLKKLFCAISGIKDDSFWKSPVLRAEGVVTIKPGQPIEVARRGSQIRQRLWNGRYREPFGLRPECL